ncbi:N-acetyltransferase family protein [Streptomyces sp. NPDC055078]
MPESRIRPARLADDAALARLDRDTWSTLHAVTPRPLPPYDPFFDSSHRPEDYLVAEAIEAGAKGTDRSVIGYIRLVPPTALACNQHVRQIQGLAVDGRARGRGVGRALVRAACGAARRQGAVRITLRVLGHNAPARALYEAEGFAVEGVLRGEFWLDGRYVDDVVMGRALS